MQCNELHCHALPCTAMHCHALMYSCAWAVNTCNCACVHMCSHVQSILRALQQKSLVSLSTFLYDR